MKSIIPAICIFLMMSCSKSNDGFKYLEGSYSLTFISCECPLTEIDPREQQWKFNFEDSEVEVKISDEAESNIFLENGVYPFELIEDGITSVFGTSNLIRLNGQEYGLTRNETEIILDLNAPWGTVDASVYTFTKN